MAKGAYIGVPTLSASLGDLDVGATVKLNVSGVAKDFIVVQQGTPSNLYDASCNGTWLLMKDIYTKRGWGGSSNVYADSDVHSYLNGTFLGALDAHVQSAIKQVKIPYVNGAGNGGTVSSGSNGLSTKVFLLSGYELGWTVNNSEAFPKDGYCLAYFNGASAYDSRYIGYYSGTATDWWLRSPYSYDNASALCINKSGSWSGYNVGGSYGVRPAFVLPSNLAVSDGTINGTEAGMKDVARKVKKGYIGVPKAEYEPAFADNSWRQIIKACQKNEVPSTWAVGDQKAMNIGGTEYLIDIIGINHDTYADGSGTAPLTFQMHDCYGTKYPMNSSNSNDGGWGSCAMRKTHLPAILALMPSEIQGGIKEVNKATNTQSGSNNSLVTSADKLFLLSQIEVSGTEGSNKVEGSQYAYYKEGNSIIKSLSGTSEIWFLRSYPAGNSAQFLAVWNNSTGISGIPANDKCGVAFAFCFGGTSEVDSSFGGGVPVARKIKKAYIGVEADVPIYEEQAVNVTDANIAEFFDVEKSTYWFRWQDGAFVSNTTSDSQTAESTWIAKANISNLSFDYSVSSEQNYDKFTVKIKDVIVADAISGIQSGRWEGSLSAGDKIVLTYTKDNSQSKNDDEARVFNIVAVARAQAGTGRKSVAKLCWEALNPVYTERMLVYKETNTLNFTDLPFEPKYFALETLGTIQSSSAIYVASIYADKESGLMRIVYKANSQSGFLQYTETYDGDGSIKVQWGKNSFYAYLVSYKFYSHSTSGVPYRVTIWG